MEHHVVDVRGPPLPRFIREWLTLHLGECFADRLTRRLGFDDGRWVVQDFVLVDPLRVDNQQGRTVVTFVSENKAVCLVQLKLLRDNVVVTVAPDTSWHRSVDVVSPMVFNGVIARLQQTIASLGNVEAVRELLDEFLVEEVEAWTQPCFYKESLRTSCCSFIPRGILSRITR